MEIDRIPLSQLPSRYGIARSALYTRLKDLQIEPIKEGRKAYIDGQQLQLLDALHQHIQKGGTTNQFLQQTRTGQSSTDSHSTPVQDSLGQIIPNQPHALVPLLETLIQRLIPVDGSRLSYLRELEEAYEKGWLLSTSEIADLLSLSPKTIIRYGQEFLDAGFIFTRVGTRKGGEIAWAISKIDDLDIPSQTSEMTIKEAFSSVLSH